MEYMKKQFKKRSLIIGGVILVVIVAAIITSIALSRQNQVRTEADAPTPGYQTLLPSNTSIKQLGGWKRVSPEANAPVYAYVDTIDGIAISVSEQPIPDSFKPDVESHVANLAKSDSATNIVKSNDLTLYIGLSSKGPQSVYFTKNDLLILIKSEKQIKNEAWSTYASSLQ